jgi:class 3 adenylate cyclase
VNAEVPVEFDDPMFSGEVSEFLTGSRTAAHVERSLAVVLFADIAGSTDLAAKMGDAT